MAAAGGDPDDIIDLSGDSQPSAGAGAQGNPHLGRVFALHGASLAPAERACLARLPDDVLALLACGSVTVQEALFAVARDVPSPARASAGGGAAEEARARAAAQARALAAVAEADDADDGFEMTACIEPAEPAWLARARAALTSLLSESALAPRATREASLSALEGIIGSATRAGEAAAGRAVYLDKLRARVAKAQAPSAVKLEHAAASAPKSSRLSAAHSSPHGGAGAASGDDAAVTRCVDMICRVLSSAGWYLDSDGEESATGQPRARILLLAEARELPALLARLRDVASLLETLRADAKRADAAKRAEAALTAALEAIVIDSDEDEDASAAAWAERSAADAAKVLLAPVATPEPDPAAAPGFDAGFDDELWERYARSGAGRAESPPPPAESPQQHDVAKPAASPVARSAAITILSDDDDDVEIVAVVQAPRRAARAPPPPREECRITLFLPEGRGRARLLLPPTATLLDAYAAAKDYLATPARAVGVAFAPPVLPAHNWRTAAVVDTQSHKLVRPDPAPGRAFKPHELATTTLAQAGLFPSGRLVLERAGAVLRAPRIVAGRIDVLRLTTPLPNGNTLVSPIVHLHDPMGDLGVAMFKKMEPLLPGGWEQARHSWLVAGINGGRHPMPVVLNNSYWQGQNGALGGRASIPAQDYAEDLMKRASNAVRAHVGGGARAANAAADDLRRSRPLFQASGLLYLSDGALVDHVDGIGHYLCLMTMGCAVDFTAGDRVVRFQSGDAIIFNGGRAHGVMHGVPKVHANTGPLSLPKLRNARLSLQLRQQ